MFLMQKKWLFISFVVVSVLIIGSVGFASAGWWSDFLGKITGYDVASSCVNQACDNNQDGFIDAGKSCTGTFTTTYFNAAYKTMTFSNGWGYANGEFFWDYPDSDWYAGMGNCSLGKYQRNIYLYTDAGVFSGWATGTFYCNQTGASYCQTPNTTTQPSTNTTNTTTTTTTQTTGGLAAECPSNTIYVDGTYNIPDGYPIDLYVRAGGEAIIIGKNFFGNVLVESGGKLFINASNYCSSSGQNCIIALKNGTTLSVRGSNLGSSGNLTIYHEPGAIIDMYSGTTSTGAPINTNADHSIRIPQATITFCTPHSQPTATTAQSTTNTTTQPSTNTTNTTTTTTTQPSTNTTNTTTTTTTQPSTSSITTPVPTSSSTVAPPAPAGFFARSLCRLSNMFNSQGYLDCLNNYRGSDWVYLNGSMSYNHGSAFYNSGGWLYINNGWVDLTNSYFIFNDGSAIYYSNSWVYGVDNTTYIDNSWQYFTNVIFYDGNGNSKLLNDVWVYIVQNWQAPSYSAPEFYCTGGFKDVNLCTDTFSEAGTSTNCVPASSLRYLCANRQLYVCGKLQDGDWGVSVTDDTIEISGMRCNILNDIWTVPTMVNSCRVILDPGIYVLSEDLSVSSSSAYPHACLHSSYSLASNIILDGNGHSLTGYFYNYNYPGAPNIPGGYGIKGFGGTELIVENFGDITNLEFGIASNSGNLMVKNSRISGNTWGIFGASTSTTVIGSQIVSNEWNIQGNTCHVRDDVQVIDSIVSGADFCDFTNSASCDEDCS